MSFRNRPGVGWMAAAWDSSNLKTAVELSALALDTLQAAKAAEQPLSEVQTTHKEV